MDLMKVLMEQLGNEEVLAKLGNSVGAEPSQVQNLAKLGLPALLQAMNKNASVPEGAEALHKALEQHQDDGVNDLAGFLNHVDLQDGQKMLQHIFPGQKDQVQNNLAGKTGLDASQVSGLMAQLAPVLLGMLGQQKKQNNVGAAQVPDLLGSLLGQGKNGGLMGMAGGVLDSNKDGSIVDDLGNLLGGFFKKG